MRTRSWCSRAFVGVVLLAVGMFGLGATCGGSGPTDCYEMRTASGTTGDGTPCSCTFYYPSTDSSASGPVCHQECRDDRGRTVFDCSALP